MEKDGSKIRNTIEEKCGECKGYNKKIKNVILISQCHT